MTVDMNHRKTKSQILRELALKEKMKNQTPKRKKRRLRESKSSNLILRNRKKSKKRLKRKTTQKKLSRPKSRKIILLSDDENIPKVPKLDLENVIFGNKELLKVSKQGLRKSVSKSKARNSKKKKKKRKRKFKKKIKDFIPSCALSNKMTQAALQRQNENKKHMKEIQRVKEENLKYKEWDNYKKYKREITDRNLEYHEQELEREKDSLMRRKHTPTRIITTNSKQFESVGSSFKKKMRVLKEYTPRMKKNKKKKKKKVIRNKTPKLSKIKEKRNHGRSKTPVRNKTPMRKFKKKRRKRKEKKIEESEFYEITREDLKNFTSKNNNLFNIVNLNTDSKEPDSKQNFDINPGKYFGKFESSDRLNLRSLEGKFPYEKDIEILRHGSSPKFSNPDSDMKEEFDERWMSSTPTHEGIKLRDMRKIHEVRTEQDDEEFIDESKYATFKKKSKKGSSKIVFVETGNGFNSITDKDEIVKVEKRQVEEIEYVESVNESEVIFRRTAQEISVIDSLNTGNEKCGGERKRPLRRQSFEFSPKFNDEIEPEKKKEIKGKKIKKVQKKENKSNGDIFSGKKKNRKLILNIGQLQDMKVPTLKPLKLKFEGISGVKISRYSNKLTFAEVDPAIVNFTPLTFQDIRKQNLSNPPLKHEKFISEFTFKIKQPKGSHSPDLLSVSDRKKTQRSIEEESKKSNNKESPETKDKTVSIYYEEEEISFDPNEDISSFSNNRSKSGIMKMNISIKRTNTDLMLDDVSEIEFDPNGSSVDINKSKTKDNLQVGDISSLMVSEGPDEDMMIESYQGSSVFQSDAKEISISKKNDSILLEASQEVKNLGSSQNFGLNLSKQVSKGSKGREYFSPRKASNLDDESDDSSSLMYNSFSFQSGFEQ